MIRSEKEFDYIKIKLASPMRILQWSHRKLPNGQFVGEVQKSESENLNHPPEFEFQSTYNLTLSGIKDEKCLSHLPCIDLEFDHEEFIRNSSQKTSESERDLYDD